jgi:LSU ribosomal protein L19P
MLPVVREIEKKYMRSDLPKFNPGDTVKVYFRLKEGKKKKGFKFLRCSN